MYVCINVCLYIHTLAYHSYETLINRYKSDVHMMTNMCVL